ERFSVGGGERLAAADLTAHTTRVAGARANREQVRAVGGDRCGDRGLRAGTDRHQRDYGCYTDDDAKGRQQGAQFVGGQALERDVERLDDADAAVRQLLDLRRQLV